MNYKWIGALLVVIGCGGFGFSMAASYRTEVLLLQQLLQVIQNMSSELKYRLTPLPELCKRSALTSSALLNAVFQGVAGELERQLSPDACSCMAAVLEKYRESLPVSGRKLLMRLGESLGRFDMDGQLRDLEGVNAACRAELNRLEKNRDIRIRNYQTLGLCAGAAIAILFV